MKLVFYVWKYREIYLPPRHLNLYNAERAYCTTYGFGTVLVALDVYENFDPSGIIPYDEINYAEGFALFELRHVPGDSFACLLWQ